MTTTTTRAKQHAKSNAALRTEIEKLAELIQEHYEASQRAWAAKIEAEKKLFGRQEERDDLLAAVLIGDGDQDALSKAEADVTELAASVDEHRRAADKANGLLAALEKRHRKACTSLESSTRAGRAVAAEVLIDEAVQVGVEYSKAAAALIPAYTRLMGLYRAARRLGGDAAARIFNAPHQDLDIPRFEALMPSTTDRYDDRRALFLSGREQMTLADAEAKVQAWLAKQGLPIL